MGFRNPWKGEIISKDEGLDFLPGGERDWLVGGGEMGRLIRSMDWSRTPLGPRESWPQSLRTTISLCLSSNFPIAIVWGPRHVQIYNDGYWPICGSKHPQSMGQNFWECWPTSRPAIGAAFDQAAAGEAAFITNQCVFLDRDGYLEETFFTFSFSPIRDESGEVGGLFHPVTELTQQTLAERRLEVLRRLAERTADARTVDQAIALAMEALAPHTLDLPFLLFYRLGADGQQATLAGSVGLAAGTPASPPSIDLDGDSPPAWPLPEAGRSHQCLTVELSPGRFGSGFGPLSCAPFPESIGTAVAIPVHLPGTEQALGVAIAGVSPRRALDEPYSTFHAMLRDAIDTAVANAHSYEQERRRAEALAEIDRAKTAFFSNVSHEFRTPLTLMLGPLEEVLQDPGRNLPDSHAQLLHSAHRNALRLLKLVNSLLDFSRIEAGRIEGSYAAVDLAAFTAELAGVFRSAIEAAGLRLVVDCPPLPEPVFVDRDMWEKIVLNLLSNAFKFTFTGTITVRVRWAKGRAALTVADTGTGIPAEHLPRLFERFYRVPNARGRTYEGSGIGLALVHELVKLHGGTLTVVSEPDRGTTFNIELPAGSAHLPAERITNSNSSAGCPPASTAIGPHAFLEEALHWLPGEGAAPASIPADEALPAPENRGRARILLADDNADMRDYVRRLLAPHWEVEAAADGLQALEAARRRVPDLVLTDVMMPGLDGFGLLQALRADEPTRGTPVIMLSARAGDEARVEGVEAGADDYLVKPFSARELLARVRTQLELAAERREMADILRRTNEELEQRVATRTAELARANEALLHSNMELERFAYATAHDLQTPLRSIASFTQLLQEEIRGCTGERAQEWAGLVIDNTRRLQLLIQDLIDYTRLEAEGLPFSALDLQEALDEALGHLGDLIRQTGAEIRNAPLPTLAVDRTQFAQLLQNLVGNAIKYNRSRPPRVSIHCEPRDGEWAFSVADNGIGIDPRHHERIFEIFRRLHTYRQVPGTGIGLALCRRIVERHGGRIWVESRPGEGSTFHFTVPDQARRPDPARHA